jgi:hypothetical protein
MKNVQKLILITSFGETLWLINYCPYDFTSPAVNIGFKLIVLWTPPAEIVRTATVSAAKRTFRAINLCSSQPTIFDYQVNRCVVIVVF